MYSELTPRVFVGGYVNPNVNVNILVRSGVTHVVNASGFLLDPIVKNQFRTLELREANLDAEHDRRYWPRVFRFTRSAISTRNAKLYFHVSPENPLRPAFPVACYAALLSLGYSEVNAVRRLLAVHPILTPHEVGMCCVNRSFAKWKKSLAPKSVQAEIIHDDPPEPKEAIDAYVGESIRGHGLQGSAGISFACVEERHNACTKVNCECPCGHGIARMVVA